MTFLFLSRRFYPQIGGVETHILEIGKRLVKNGHDVIVVSEDSAYKGISHDADIYVVKYN